MAYTTPKITASGRTWADLRDGGFVAQVEGLIATNPDLTDRQRSLLRGAAQGSGDVLRSLVTHLDNFLSGRPVPHGDVNDQLFDAATVLKALLAATEEIARLVDANPGTIRPQINPAGEHAPERTWT